MTDYICKCGRVVRKSTKADTTGNRDTAGCEGCPYLLPWGPTEWDKGEKRFVQRVEGHACRMSKSIQYSTTVQGNWNDKLTLHIQSLDLDFLERVHGWIKQHYPDRELSGYFSRDTMRGCEFAPCGRYSYAISCSANKKGIAAKAALADAFFDRETKTRKDLTPDEERSKILADIEKGKAAFAARKEKTMGTVYRDPEGVLYKIASPGGALAGVYVVMRLDAAPGSQWRQDDDKNVWPLAQQRTAQEYLGGRALESGWHVVPDDVAEETRAGRPAKAPGGLPDKVYKDAKGVLYKVGEIGELGNADRCRLTIKQLATKPGSQWRKMAHAQEWRLSAVKDALHGLEIMAAYEGWTLAEDEEIMYTMQGRPALIGEETEPEQPDEKPTPNPAAESGGTDLSVLGLSHGAALCMSINGVQTVEELEELAKDDAALVRLRGLGNRTLAELRAALTKWQQDPAPEAAPAGPAQDGPEHSPATLAELRLSPACVKYLTADLCFDEDDPETLRSLLDSEKKKIAERYPEDWNKIAAFLQPDQEQCACAGCGREDCICAGGKDGPEREACPGDHNCQQSGCSYVEKHRAAPDALPVDTARTEPADAVPAENAVVAFDCSGLASATVDALHWAEGQIKDARRRYITEVAEAVAVAHDALVSTGVRNSDSGKFESNEDTFIRWCRSVGISKSTAYQLLQVNALITGATAEEQAQLEQASPSLLYAAARPSAPAELVQGVKSGDITTHKQYKELEKALAEAREALRQAEVGRDAAVKDIRELERDHIETEALADQEIEKAAARAQEAERQLTMQAAERDKARQQADTLLMEKQEQQRRIAELERSLSSAHADYGRAQKTAADAQRAWREAEQQAAGWEQDMAEMQALLEKAEADADEARRALAEAGTAPVEATVADPEEIERRAAELAAGQIARMTSPLTATVDAMRQTIDAAWTRSHLDGANITSVNECEAFTALRELLDSMLDDVDAAIERYEGRNWPT